MATIREPNSYILVMPGEYGILRRSQSPTEPTTLATVHMNINFPLGIRSADKRVGIFTVIDVASKCSEIIFIAANQLRSVADEVILQTANFSGQVTKDQIASGNPPGEIGSKTLQGVNCFFEGFREVFGRDGISVIATEHLADPHLPTKSDEIKEHGTGALFSLEDGIIIVRNNDIPHDEKKVRIKESLRFQAIMKAIRGEGPIPALERAW